MGINGLLPCLRSVSRAAHVREYAGQRVAVDSYVWLHRGAFTCARELALNEPTDKFVAYFMRQVEVLQRAGVEPLCVFDGDKLPSKAAEEAERERRRSENREKAEAHERSGNHTAAYECYQRAVDVSPAMAARVIQELRRRGVPFLVAPFEADAQLAHLALTGAVAAVVTEDSDLVAYGAPRVFLKLDARTGAGFEVAAAALPRCRELNLGGLSAEQFTALCVLCGCDFAPGVPGVGPRRAAALLRRFRTPAAVLRHLRFEGAAVPPGHEAALQRALWTFAHQYVYDTATRRCIHRTPLQPGPDGLPPDAVLGLLGAPPPPDEAAAIAEGRLDPITRRAFSDHVFAPTQARAAMPPPQQRNSIQNYFAQPAAVRGGAGGAGGAAGGGGAACLHHSSGAEPSAEDEEEEEEEAAAAGEEEVEEAVASAAPPSKRVRAADAAALKSLMHGILGATPTPHRGSMFSVYADAPPGSASSAGAGASPAVEPSPARAHPMSWPASAAARPLPRPLQPRPANLYGRLAAVASAPAGDVADTSPAARPRFTSKFFSPPATVSAPPRPSVAATEAVEEAAPSPVVDDAAPCDAHRVASTSASPALGIDVRHASRMAAAAEESLDARLAAFRRTSGDAPLRSPLHSPSAVPGSSGAKRGRARAAPAAPAPRLLAAASFDTFLFTPRAKPPQ